MSGLDWAAQEQAGSVVASAPEKAMGTHIAASNNAAPNRRGRDMDPH